MPLAATCQNLEDFIDQKLVVADRKLKVDSVRQTLQNLAFVGAAVKKMPFSCVIVATLVDSTNFLLLTKKYVN